MLILAYLVTNADYNMVGPCALYNDPRCASDLIYLTQIETVAVLCIIIFATGLAINRKRQGVFYLALILVLLLLAAYIIPLYLPSFYTSPQTIQTTVQPATTITSFTTYNGSPT
jgi:hypothetical protein